MTEVQLRELFESEIRRVEARIEALAAEVNKSETMLNRRLESMNEFREALKDQAAQMATREQLRMTSEKHDDRSLSLESRIRQLEQHRYFSVGVATTIALVVSLALRYL